jgi:hypothetical protein
MEAQDLQRKEFEATIKAFDAETKRLTAVQASMTPEQIQDIVMGTISGMITSGDLINEMPRREMPEMNEPMPEQMQGQMPPEMMQGQMPPPQQPMAIPPEGMQQ